MTDMIQPTIRTSQAYTMFSYVNFAVAAVMMAGGWRRSRARSALVITSATPPSLSWQQSSSRSTGSMIHRDF